MPTHGEYEAFTDETAIYPQRMDKLQAGTLFDIGLTYCCLKLPGEVGELVEHLGKAVRDDGGFISTERRDAMLKELGDIEYYTHRIAKHLGYTMEEVLEINMAKLRDRKARGVLGGSGDDR